MNNPLAKDLEVLSMDSRPQGLFLEIEKLAATVAKIPGEAIEELDEESPGPMRWTAESARRLIKNKACGFTAEESRALRKHIRRQEKRDLGLFEVELATVVSQPGDCHVGCPCRLVARWEAGKVVLVQRYDPEFSDEDRELGVFEQLPTGREAIELVGAILNDPEWVQAGDDDVQVLETWQETLGRQDAEQPEGWEMRVISEVYPALEKWFAEKWERVLRETGETGAVGI